MVRTASVPAIALAATLLASCGGPSVPGLPSPASGIGALTDVFGSRFGLGSIVARRAVGGMLGVASSRLGEAAWNSLASNIPGASDLLDETLSSLPEGTTLDSLADVGDMLSDEGVTDDQLDEMGSAMSSYLSEAAESDSVRSQIADLF
jgi:hypothetical protein